MAVPSQAGMHQQVFLLFLTLLCVKRRFVCSFRTRISIWCPNNCVLCRWCAVCDYGCPGLWPSTPKGQNHFDLVKIKANGVSPGFEKFHAWKFNDFQSSIFLSNIPVDAHFATFKDLTGPQGLNDDEELWNTKWTQNGSKKKPQNRKYTTECSSSENCSCQNKMNSPEVYEIRTSTTHYDHHESRSYCSPPAYNPKKYWHFWPCYWCKYLLCSIGIISKILCTSCALPPPKDPRIQTKCILIPFFEETE